MEDIKLNDLLQLSGGAGNIEKKAIGTFLDDDYYISYLRNGRRIFPNSPLSSLYTIS